VHERAHLSTLCCLQAHVQSLGGDGGRGCVAKVRKMGVDHLILPEGSKISFVNFPGQHISFIEGRVAKIHYEACVGNNLRYKLKKISK